MIPEAIQPLVTVIRSDAGGEFSNLLYHLNNRGWRFPTSSSSQRPIMEKEVGVAGEVEVGDNNEEDEEEE